MMLLHMTIYNDNIFSNVKDLGRPWMLPKPRREIWPFIDWGVLEFWSSQPSSWLNPIEKPWCYFSFTKLNLIIYKFQFKRTLKRIFKCSVPSEVQNEGLFQNWPYFEGVMVFSSVVNPAAPT